MSDGEVYATMLRRVRSALRRGAVPAAHVVTVGAARAGAANRSRPALQLQRVEADDERGRGGEAVGTRRTQVPSHWTGIFVHRAMSAEEAAPRFASRFFDLVFLDGDHSAEGVRRDLAAWAPRTRGVLAGHDYNPAGYPGLLKALYAWKDADTEFRHPLIVDADYTWWTVRGG
ncbi:unnamed protein product [Prorocentrum cordatum]|uniref:Class I SAM-dependent methyltransferase n=1 Tax=Prorocentrum cordatum TaxID=2364126 RepID=A0ABN9WD87_9DINO|nr:unnamed protein product [Polarella glacialis]